MQQIGIRQKLYCFGTAEVCTYIEGGAHSLAALVLLRQKERAGKVPIFLPAMLPFISSHLIYGVSHRKGTTGLDPRPDHGTLARFGHGRPSWRVRDGGEHGRGQEMRVGL